MKDAKQHLNRQTRWAMLAAKQRSDFLRFPLTKLSVIIITHNEAANIGACIASVPFADEIIVVDSGSTDATVDIARSCGAKVVTTLDWPGFGPQKNRALDLATSHWVLSLDADERVSSDLADQIKATIDEENQPSDAFSIPRLTQFCGQWIRHCGWTPDLVVRLFKRNAARFSYDLVHERLVVNSSRVSRLQAPLLHYSYPTPSHYWRKLEQYSGAWARQHYATGKRTSMLRAFLSGLTAFVRSYVFRLGFLDGSMGFAVCVMQGQAAFGKYFELYCLHKKNEQNPE